MKNIENYREIIDTFGFKLLIIFILGLLLLIPVNFIRSVILDRISYQKEAISSIIEPIGGNCNIQGIVVAIPYMKRHINSETKEIFYKKEYIFYMPDEYSIIGNIEVKPLKRGIFKAPIFNSTLNLKGSFNKYNSEMYSIDKNDNILFDEAILIFGIDNKKNLIKLPDITVKYNDSNEKLNYYEKNIYADLKLFNNNFIFEISRDKLFNGFDFDITLNIQGGNFLAFTPMASENTFEISSLWKDPSFSGSFLPTSREVNNNGFNAIYNIASFNTPFNKYWKSEDDIINNTYYSSGKYHNSTKISSEESDIYINFLLLNDNYNKTLRSVKYSIIFIFIPFFVLLLCEILSKNKIHPIQYILIGITNVIFYLLLLSISEHINFNLSYFISAIMVIVLSSTYIKYIIKSIKYALIMSLVQTLIYVFLFGILQLTDYALLIGSLGLFIVIAMAMYFTRNINWYAKNT